MGPDAAARSYPIIAGDVGPLFYYPLPTAQTKLYVRFLYKQSNPFNLSGTTNNQDSLGLVQFHDLNRPGF